MELDTVKIIAHFSYILAYTIVYKKMNAKIKTRIGAPHPYARRKRRLKWGGFSE